MSIAHLLLGITLLIGALTACGVPARIAREAVVGSGTLVVTTRPVTGVSEVSLDGSGTLTVTQGPIETLAIEAEDTILPHLRAEVDGARLVLRQDERAGLLRPTRPIAYHLTVRHLTALDLAGDGSAEATGITTDRLIVRLNGAGTMRLADLSASELGAFLNGSGTLSGSGVARQQRITLNGAGRYLGDALQATSADVTLNGAGQARVRVSDRLNLAVSGPGEVTTIGQPVITRQLTNRGSGRVE